MEAKDKVFQFVEQQPEFPGGMGALSEFLSNNIEYPKAEKKKGIEGTVIVTFVVDKDGSVKNIQALATFTDGQALIAEAVRVVQEMPKWKPGKINGDLVKVQYNLPIKFSLRNSR